MWVLLFAFAVGFVFQFLSIKIGLLGRHLAQACKYTSHSLCCLLFPHSPSSLLVFCLCREEFPPQVSRLLWVAAEVSIIACDIQGILATAIAVKILFGLPLWLGSLFTCLDLLTFMLIDFAEVDSHQIEWFFVSLVAMMAVCFFWNFSVNPPSSYRLSPFPFPALPSLSSPSPSKRSSSAPLSPLWTPLRVSGSLSGSSALWSCHRTISCTGQRSPRPPSLTLLSAVVMRNRVPVNDLDEAPLLALLSLSLLTLSLSFRSAEPPPSCQWTLSWLCSSPS
jgi:hypothetical protein